MGVSDFCRKQWLVRFAKKLGSALNELATIVHPGTIRRSIRKAAATKPRRQKKNGRPRTAEQFEKLILKLAGENNWGYARLFGELRKVGIHCGHFAVIRVTDFPELDLVSLSPAGGFDDSW